MDELEKQKNMYAHIDMGKFKCHGIGISHKKKDGMALDQKCVTFFTEKKVPKSSLKEEEIIPKEIIVDNVKYITDVVQSPTATLHNCVDCGRSTQDTTVDGITYAGDADILRTRQLDGTAGEGGYLRGGCQINGRLWEGWPWERWWARGTVGFFAIDRYDNRVVGVTNTHVAVLVPQVVNMEEQVNSDYFRSRADSAGRARIDAGLEDIGDIENSGCAGYLYNTLDGPGERMSHPFPEADENFDCHPAGNQPAYRDPNAGDYCFSWNSLHFAENDRENQSAAFANLSNVAQQTGCRTTVKRWQTFAPENLIDAALLIPPVGLISEHSHRFHEPDGQVTLEHLEFATEGELSNLLNTHGWTNENNQGLVYKIGRTCGPQGFCPTKRLKIVSANYLARITLKEYDKTSLCGVTDETQTHQQLRDGGGYHNPRFYSCIQFAYVDETLPHPSYSGDSGSVVIAQFNGEFKIIGLNFAGNGSGDKLCHQQIEDGDVDPSTDGSTCVYEELPHYGLANRIDNVARLLNIKAWTADETPDITTYPTASFVWLNANTKRQYGGNSNQFTAVGDKEVKNFGGCFQQPTISIPDAPLGGPVGGEQWWYAGFRRNNNTGT